MILIAHRGNLEGKNPSRENSPDYIDEAISQGYSVEIDVRILDNEVCLGHDRPDYRVTKEWLHERRNALWCHAKDKSAFEFLLKEKMHCFWHDTDDYTMTSFGYVWAYPGKSPVGSLCIMVMPELHMAVDDMSKLETFGICSDYVKYINR